MSRSIWNNEEVHNKYMYVLFWLVFKCEFYVGISLLNDRNSWINFIYLFTNDLYICCKTLNFYFVNTLISLMWVFTTLIFWVTTKRNSSNYKKKSSDIIVWKWKIILIKNWFARCNKVGNLYANYFPGNRTISLIELFNFTQEILTRNIKF